MKIKHIKANMTEITLKDDPQIRVLFSYETPVACSILTPEGKQFFRTERFYSVTTSRHINSWLPKDQAKEVPQEEIDNIVR